MTFESFLQLFLSYNTVAYLSLIVVLFYKETLCSDIRIIKEVIPKGTNISYIKFQNWTALKTILTYFSIINTARMTGPFSEISFFFVMSPYYYCK